MAKAIREAYGKALLHRRFEQLLRTEENGQLQQPPFRTVSVAAGGKLSDVVDRNPWMEKEVRVCGKERESGEIQILPFSD